MMKKLKNFCRLTHHSEGFTLVELVVVIAIVAILSGIAVPAYGAYVEKSQKAGDLQLLAAVNKAFAAAVFENGQGIENVEDAALKLGPPKSRAASTDAPLVVERIESIRLKDGSAANVEEYNEAFFKYYADNEASEFKAIKKLWFTEGVFAEDIITMYSYGGGSIAIYQSDISKLADSAFITALPGGVGALLDKVDSVVGFGMGMLMDDEGITEFGQLILGDEYMENLATALGVSKAEVKAKVDAMAAKMVGNQYEEGTEEYENALNAAAMQIYTNNAVLSAAKDASSKEELLTILQRDDPKQAIISAMGTEKPEGGYTGTGLSQAAAAYGMYTAFINSRPDDYTYDGKTKAELVDATSDPLDILNGLKNDDFIAYMKTPEAEEDLDGYLAAMNMINESAKDSDAVSEVLMQGFGDDALAALIQQAMGKK